MSAPLARDGSPEDTAGDDERVVEWLMEAGEEEVEGKEENEAEDVLAFLVEAGLGKVAEEGPKPSAEGEDGERAEEEKEEEEEEDVHTDPQPSRPAAADAGDAQPDHLDGDR